MSRRRDAPSRAAPLEDVRQHPTSDSLITWSELQPWQRDNEYILTHYRRASYSIAASLRSISRVHNETVNIWSHGLGSLGWAALLLHFFYVVAPSYKQATVGDALAVGTLYLSIVVCFVLSSSFHIFLNHSPQTWRLASQLDHLGIVLVIWGSSIPADYFGFYCEPHFQRRYWILATSCAAASAYATFQSVFRTPTGRKIRFLLYTALGVSAFVPVVHGIRLHGWAAQNRKMSISYFCGLGVLNFTGAAIYAARIPERWYPGRFDVWGASHQIMHVLVMCGAVSHSLGLVRALEYWVGLKAVGKTCP